MESLYVVNLRASIISVYYYTMVCSLNSIYVFIGDFTPKFSVQLRDPSACCSSDVSYMVLN